MNRRTAFGFRNALLVLAGAWLLCVPGLPAQVQIQVAPNGQLIPAGEGSDPSLQPRADIDKELSKALRKAEDYRDRGDFDSAVEIVQRYVFDAAERGEGKRLADKSADYFTDQSMNSSLKREALRLIGGLPSEGRRQYESRYGDAARAMLDEAVSSGDVAGLENVARQYFHTKAGYEAAYLIGTHRLDQGEPLAAAFRFEQLRELPVAAGPREPMLSLKSAIAWYRAGEKQRAIEALIQLKKATPEGRLDVGGKRLALFASDKDAEGWLARLVGLPATAAQASENQWAMFRGDPARHGVGSPASPAWDSVWEFAPLYESEAVPPAKPRGGEISAERLKRYEQQLKQYEKRLKRLEEIEQQLTQMQADRQSEDLLALPAVHPLIVGDAVIFRTLRNIRAVHRQTGELLWEPATVSQPYQEMIDLPGAESQVRPDHRHNALANVLAECSWSDLANGTLSSDGRNIYALEATSAREEPLPRNIRRAGATLRGTDSNKLVALSLAAGGKLLWESGGRREDELEVAGAFFLGPPLPLEGCLYCIVEVSGDVRLAVLDSATGRLEWSLTLALPDDVLRQHPVRRQAGLTPAYSNGVLVCPTGSGAVVAIDPARRILLWGRRYSRNIPGSPADPRQAIFMRGRRVPTIIANRGDEERWLDAAPAIADNHVLLTPRDSDELHCLSLLDGSLLWKKSRGQSLYLATVFDGKVVLVGRAQVEALKLATGEPAWTEPVAIEMPSGRGVGDGRHYRLPLSTAEIVSIDLAEGRIVARSKSRSGEVFGNLAAAGGTIVSQTIDKVVGFGSLEGLRGQTDEVLAANPDDAGALALRGEMRLHEGKEDAGLADLRRAIAIEPTPRSRALLVAALLEGLRHNFAKYRPVADEIEKLVEDPQQRGRYLRLFADGLHAAGDRQGAFREYLKLADADTGKPELERLNATLSVRSDRWIRPRIADVYRQSSGAERDELDRAIAELLKQAAEPATETSRLRRFLNAFADLQVSDRAGQLLASRLSADEEPLQQEQLLLRLRRSQDRSLAGLATARLASLSIDRRHPSAAAVLLDELATQFNDTVCLDEKTGRQLVEEWRADEDVSRLLDDKLSWPAQKIGATKVGRRGAVRQKFRVQILGPRGPLGGDWTLTLDNQKKNLIAVDADGKELWRLPTGKLDEQIPQVYGNVARVSGHLVIAAFGTHFAVLDALHVSKAGPRILWQARLVDGGKDQARGLRPQFRQIVGPGGVRVMNFSDLNGRPLGKVVPIDDSFICYQTGTRLRAADPLTGETLWERRGAARGCEIFGDREFVFLVPPDSKEAIVLRAADGQQIATRPLPQEGTRLSSSGRHLLLWTGRVLRKLDLSSGQTAWEKRLPPGSKAISLDEAGGDVAVLNPHQGSFALFAADDGRLLIDSQIEADAGIDSFQVHRGRQLDVLLTHSPAQQAGAARVRVAPLNNSSPLVNGSVYGFDRQSGKKIWTTRVENQTFHVDQPADLPVLVFTARTYQPFQRGRRRNRNQFAVAVLDKRNGRNIYSESGAQNLSQFEMTTNAEKREMSIHFYRFALNLKLTDEPLAEPARAKDPAPADPAAE